MKAIINTAPGILEMRSLPLPEPKAGEVRIKTRACGICATDLEMIDGCARSAFPQILGHEWTGIVDKVGNDVDNVCKGRFCVGENVLSDGGEVGFEHPGGYAEYFITSFDKLQFLPKDFSMEKASLLEPLAVSIRALNRLRITNKDSAVVFGDGPIGLMILMLLKRDGVRRTGVIGGRKERLELARKLGASFCVNYHEAGNDLTTMIKNTAEIAEYPNLIEASGSENAMASLFALTSPFSRILVIGDYGEQFSHFKWLEVVHKELEIIGSNASAGAWEEAVELAVSENLPLEELITHSFPVEDFKNAVNAARKREFQAIKVLLKW